MPAMASLSLSCFQPENGRRRLPASFWIRHARWSITTPMFEDWRLLADQLPALWAARGRLLERDANCSLVGDPAPGDSHNSYARTIIAVRKAFAEARKLNDDIVYAAGQGRATLKLPRSDFDARRRDFADEL